MICIVGLSCARNSILMDALGFDSPIFCDSKRTPYWVSFCMLGASEGNRTPNLLITNELLYH